MDNPPIVPTKSVQPVAERTGIIPEIWNLTSAAKPVQTHRSNPRDLPDEEAIPNGLGSIIQPDDFHLERSSYSGGAIGNPQFGKNVDKV